MSSNTIHRERDCDVHNSLDRCSLKITLSIKSQSLKCYMFFDAAYSLNNKIIEIRGGGVDRYLKRATCVILDETVLYLHLHTGHINVIK